MTKKEFRAGFRDSIEALKNGENGTYFWWLKKNDRNDNDWAIVLGWTYDGDSGIEENPYHKDGFQIAAKIAFQSNKSIMQCDFDVDWNLPYDKETGEVWECDYYIDEETDIDEVLDFFEKEWHEHKEEFIDMVA